MKNEKMYILLSINMISTLSGVCTVIVPVIGNSFFVPLNAVNSLYVVKRILLERINSKVLICDFQLCIPRILDNPIHAEYSVCLWDVDLM
jgi:hypothetical protein